MDTTSKHHKFYNKQCPIIIITRIPLTTCKTNIQTSNSSGAECCQPLPAWRPLRPNVTSSIKPEVHNVAELRRRKPSHSHRVSAHKISCRSVQRLKRYARGQTNTQTGWSQYSAPLLGRRNYLRRSSKVTVCASCQIRSVYLTRRRCNGSRNIAKFREVPKMGVTL